jgi:hypothetical protein
MSELVEGRVYRLRNPGVEFTGEDHGWLWIYTGVEVDERQRPRDYFKSVATGERQWFPVYWFDLD